MRVKSKSSEEKIIGDDLDIVAGYRDQNEGKILGARLLRKRAHKDVNDRGGRKSW